MCGSLPFSLISSVPSEMVTIRINHLYRSHHENENKDEFFTTEMQRMYSWHMIYLQHILSFSHHALVQQ